VGINEQAAKGFSAGADAYERGRPDYSPEAIARLAQELQLGSGKKLLDLAAGTGKLTRQLVDTGAEIVAVEPIAEMRAKLEVAVPSATAIEGTAENIPLPNHSVDAVVVGQAFHWFDGLRAASEIRRVLKVGGALGLIWQSRDDTEPWVKKLNDIIDRADRGNPRFRSESWRTIFETTALFEPIEEATYRHVQRGAPSVFLDRVGSISYVSALPDEQRQAVLAEVDQLLATDPATKGKATVELPYFAHVFWTHPRQAPAGPSTGLLLSVNISPGGVPKLPIPRGRMGWRGIDGDRHAAPEPIHGTVAQAACLYAFEAIERIRAEGHQAFPGAYGENLTLAGLDWGGLRHGDLIRVGDRGPLLELTDYAVPCDKQARWFLDGRTGRISARKHPQDARWYARVVEEGDVAAGDLVHLVRTA
jgi:MOSC domain-containing protein YiiM/ubiquinone/menaquinone biosynthesis C-methylase UbiE